MKHGAYSSRLPEEQVPLFEEILAEYMTDVPNPSVTDKMALVRLATYETKLRYAVQANGPPDALDLLDRLLNRTLTALQVTRESKDTARTSGTTPAEVMAALLMRVKERTAELEKDRVLPAPVVIDGEAVEVDGDGEDGG